MKLYTTDASPFGARVRIQVYKKNLPVEIAPPPGGLGSEELKNINPLHRIPVLNTGDSIIVESEVIQEFLQDKYPQPSLLGKTAESTANIRILSRITDCYLVPALDPFRAYLKGDNQEIGLVHEGLKKLHEVFAALEYFMSDDGYAASAGLSLADCSMAPLFFYVEHFAHLTDVELCLEKFPRLHAWTAAVNTDDAVSRVIGEIKKARQEK